jgi:hypothetical protein
LHTELIIGLSFFKTLKIEIKVRMWGSNNAAVSKMPSFYRSKAASDLISET